MPIFLISGIVQLTILELNVTTGIANVLVALIGFTELSFFLRVAISFQYHSFLTFYFTVSCYIQLLLLTPRCLYTFSYSIFIIVVFFSNFIDVNFINLSLSNVAFAHLSILNFVHRLNPALFAGVLPNYLNLWKTFSDLCKRDDWYFHFQSYIHNLFCWVQWITESEKDKKVGESEHLLEKSIKFNFRFRAIRDKCNVAFWFSIFDFKFFITDEILESPKAFIIQLWGTISKAFLQSIHVEVWIYSVWFSLCLLAVDLTVIWVSFTSFLL